MSYCGPHGIAHSEFLTWSEDDQDKALASVLHDRSQCQSCGTNPDDWVEDGIPVEPVPYVAEVIRCYGCQAINEARDRIPESSRDEHHVFLRRNLERQ